MRGKRAVTIDNIQTALVFQDAQRPVRATEGSAGFDAFAYVKGRETKFMSPDNQPYELVASASALFPDDFVVTLQPGHRALVGLGIKAQLPEGVVADVRPRSGSAWKQGVTILNAPGTIDEDFPNEWMALVVNSSNQPFEIHHGDRICQLVLLGYVSDQYDFQTDGQVGITTARAGGFGSTGGVKAA